MTALQDQQLLAQTKVFRNALGLKIAAKANTRDRNNCVPAYPDPTKSASSATCQRYTFVSCFCALQHTTARITSLDQFMQGAAIAARLSDAIRREMWEKWILLAGLGAITCLMRRTVGEIEACAGGAALTLQLLDEVVAIVNAVGEPPSDGFVKAARAQLTAKGSPLTSSMFRDLQRRRPIEVEDIVGDMVRLGTQAGLNAPVLEAAYIISTHIKIGSRRPNSKAV